MPPPPPPPGGAPGVNAWMDGYVVAKEVPYAAGGARIVGTLPYGGGNALQRLQYVLVGKFTFPQFAFGHTHDPGFIFPGGGGAGLVPLPGCGV